MWAPSRHRSLRPRCPGARACPRTRVGTSFRPSSLSLGCIRLSETRWGRVWTELRRVRGPRRARGGARKLLQGAQQAWGSGGCFYPEQDPRQTCPSPAQGPHWESSRAAARIHAGEPPGICFQCFLTPGGCNCCSCVGKKSANVHLSLYCGKTHVT